MLLRQFIKIMIEYRGWRQFQTRWIQYVKYTVRVTKHWHRLLREVVSILGDIKKPSGCAPGQMTLDGPAWPPEVPSSINHSLILRFQWGKIISFSSNLIVSKATKKMKENIFPSGLYGSRIGCFTVTALGLGSREFDPWKSSIMCRKRGKETHGQVS